MTDSPLSHEQLGGTAPLLRVVFDDGYTRPREAHLEEHPDMGPIVVCGGFEPYQLADPVAEALLNRDHESPEDHLDFVRRYGPVSPDLRGPIAQLDSGLYLEGDQIANEMTRRISELQQLIKRHFAVDQGPGEAPDLVQARTAATPPSDAIVEPLAAFTARAGHVKAAKATWDALERDRFSPLALAKAWPSGIELEVPKTRKEAERFVTARVPLTGMLFVGHTSEGSSLVRTVALHLSIHDLALSEVASAYLESRPYKRCENERCRRWFSVQREPTKSDHRRPSRASYCSYSCRKAQKARVRRRNRAAEGRSR